MILAATSTVSDAAAPAAAGARSSRALKIASSSWRASAVVGLRLGDIERSLLVKSTAWCGLPAYASRSPLRAKSLLPIAASHSRCKTASIRDTPGQPTLAMSALPIAVSSTSSRNAATFSPRVRPLAPVLLGDGSPFLHGRRFARLRGFTPLLLGGKGESSDIGDLAGMERGGRS